MGKRFCSLLLVLCLVMSAFSGAVHAADTTAADLETLVNTQYLEFAESLLDEDTKLDAGYTLTYRAVGRMEEDPSLYVDADGNSYLDEDGNLYLDEDSALTAAILNSGLYKNTVTEALSKAVRRMQSLCMDEMYLRGSLGWYTYARRHSLRNYDDNLNGNDEDDRLYELLLNVSELQGKADDYDNTLILLAGSAGSRITMVESAVTANSVTYDVQIQVYDDFDSVNDYSQDQSDGYNTLFAQLLTYFAKYLQAFHWEVKAEFQLTVPYTCDHTAANYSWTYDGTTMETVSAGAFTGNGATERQNTVEVETETGTTTKTLTYYELDETVRLFHDRPWVVEFTCQGINTLHLSPTESYGSGYPFLMRAMEAREREDGSKTYDQYVVGGEYHLYAAPGQEDVIHKEYTWRRDYYGFEYTDRYTGKLQTYRLENRVAEDGTNQIWLSIDGAVLGPMENYYMSDPDVKMQDQETASDWLTGKDFFINYIGSKNYGLSKAIQSVTIWENGEDGNDHYGIGQVTEATCTETGYTTYLCPVCDRTYVADETDLAAHTYEEVYFIWEEDYSEALVTSSDCVVCGTGGCVLDCTVMVEQGNGTLTFTAAARERDLLLEDTRVIRAVWEGDHVALTLPEENMGVKIMAASYEESGRMCSAAVCPGTAITTELPLTAGEVRIFFLDKKTGAPLWIPLLLSAQ